MHQNVAGLWEAIDLCFSLPSSLSKIIENLPSGEETEKIKLLRVYSGSSVSGALFSLVQVHIFS